MARLLVVDDDPGIRRTISRVLENAGHDVLTAADGPAAKELLRRETVDVVVTDVFLPGSNGLDLLQEVRSSSPTTKVIVITGEPSLESATESVRGGAFDFLSKPFTGDRLARAVHSAVRTKGLEDENRRYHEQLESRVRERTKALRQSVERLHKVLNETVSALGAALEMRDPYTAGHQRRVAQLAVAIARELGSPNDLREGLLAASLLHDLGKLRVPIEILTKPDRLSPTELEIVRQHPRAGYDVLEGIDFPWPIARIVLQHHERLDGSGYPAGLWGDAIRSEARILAVADVVEAMARERPYRAALGIDAALAEIVAHRGKKYDANAVDACVRLFRTRGFRWDATETPPGAALRAVPPLREPAAA